MVSHCSGKRHQVMQHAHAQQHKCISNLHLIYMKQEDLQPVLAAHSNTCWRRSPDTIKATWEKFKESVREKKSAAGWKEHTASMFPAARHSITFLPTLVALAVVSRILQHYRLRLRTLHHVQQPLSQVGVSWQVSIHLRVQPWWWDHAGGLWIRLCDLLLHQTLRRSCAPSSSGGLTVHEPPSAATVWARPGAAASAPGKAVVNIWAARPAGEAAPLMLSSPAHSLPLRDSLSSPLLSHSLTPL